VFTQDLDAKNDEHDTTEGLNRELQLIAYKATNEAAA
jgi:hypothetical protein